MRPWNTCAELLRLFGIEPKSDKWAARACDLVEFAAILGHFSGEDRLGDLERRFMRDLKVSPLIFWSQLKRALRPLIDAGGDTLRALGVPLIGDAPTVHALLLAVAAVLREAVTDADYTMYLQLKGVLDRDHG